MTQTRIKPRLPKGMRDFLPADMLKRDFVFNTVREVFQTYGFEPLQTPVVEYHETLMGKYGDEEKLIYRFEDHGGRQIALRYDQTVPLARVVAQYQGELVFPWRRYAIGQSYRGERPGRGRYRELWQADIDIIGASSPVADAEILAVQYEALTALGFASFTTLLNHREVLGGIGRVAGLDDAAAAGMYRAIDKLDKIVPDGVREELLRIGIGVDAITTIMDIVLIEGDSVSVLEELSERLDTVVAVIMEGH